MYPRLPVLPKTKTRKGVTEMIEIVEYWNKVEPDNAAGTRVLREYEIKRQYKIDSDFSELKSRWRQHPKMTIKPDVIIEDCGRQYGIHSYKEIKPA
ncbi:MAG: hypothetical protein V1760_02015 [Candidatus Peregrinibacteria bacterium]